MAFALAAKAGWAEEPRRRMAAGLAEELAMVGRAADAATLTLQYLQNVDSAGEGGLGRGRPRGSQFLGGRG